MNFKLGLPLITPLLIFGLLGFQCKDNSKIVGHEDTDSADSEEQPAAYSCAYINPYSNGPECKEYYGSWEQGDAKADCETIFLNPPVVGTFSEDRCTTTGAVGSCKVVEDNEHYTITWYFSHAETAESYCDSYYHGTWTDGEAEPDAGIPDACQQLMTEAFQFMTSTDVVAVTPECGTISCVDTLEKEEKWIEFSPKNSSPSSAFVFYPGGSVEPHLYAGILQKIATAGYLTVLVPMPGKNALSGYNRFSSIKADHPEIDHWFLGGHSMGGIGAISYVKDNGAAMDGLILWASYGTAEFDIHGVSLPVNSIYGEFDGQATVQKIEDSKPYTPSSTVYTPVPGANHAQFGHLCQSETDNDPKITRENQHELVAAATTHFMAEVNAGASEVHGAYTEASNRAQTWCQTAQRLVVNVSEETLAEGAIANFYSINVNDFGGTNAELSPQAEKKITVQTMFVYEGNGSSLGAPSIFTGEIWCKLKSQDSVAAALDLTPLGARGTCATINEAVVQWALNAVSEGEKAAYLESGKTLTFVADSQAETGPDLLVKSEIVFAESKTTPGTYELCSPGLEVADEQSIPENKRHVTYCKLWSPARALLWVLEQR